MDMGEIFGLNFHLLHVHTSQKNWNPFMRKITSDACYFIVKIQSPCDIIVVFWANSYFIFQMHYAKIFKMRYSKSLYQLFWKYESWFCSEVLKTHFTKYPWNHAFVGMKKKLNQAFGHSFWSNWDLDMISTSKWPSDPQFCERHLCNWPKNDQKWS